MTQNWKSVALIGALVCNLGLLACSIYLYAQSRANDNSLELVSCATWGDESEHLVAALSTAPIYARSLSRNLVVFQTSLDRLESVAMERRLPLWHYDRAYHGDTQSLLQDGLEIITARHVNPGLAHLPKDVPTNVAEQLNDLSFFRLAIPNVSSSRGPIAFEIMFYAATPGGESGAAVGYFRQHR